MVSSSVQSTRFNRLVCRDMGGREGGKGKREKGRAREAARERGEVRRLGEEERRVEEIIIVLSLY